MTVEQRWTDAAYRICAISGPDLVKNSTLIASLAQTLAAIYNEGRQSREIEVKALEMKIAQLHMAGNEFLEWYMNRRDEKGAVTDLRSAIESLAPKTEQEKSDVQ